MFFHVILKLKKKMKSYKFNKCILLDNYICKVEQSSDAILIFLVSTKIRCNKENEIFALRKKKIIVGTLRHYDTYCLANFYNIFN